MNSLTDKIMPIAHQIYNDTNPEILDIWRNILDEIDTPEDLVKRSMSLTALYSLIKDLLDSMGPDKYEDVTKLVIAHKDKAIDLLQPYIDRDIRTNSPKGDLIDELLSNDFVETGSSKLYYQLRDAISMPQKFDTTNEVPTLKIKDGGNTHVAKLLTDVEEGMILNNGQTGQWEVLMSKAITSMDDYTADTFDVISILWMNSAKNKDDFIHFSHEDVLMFRDIQKTKGGYGSATFRSKDRREVMKRIAAIASIWISSTDDEEIALVEKLDKNKDLALSKYRRLFQIDNVTFAHDRNTNEAIGIYKCDIKPTDLLSNYLFGTKKTTSFLSLKALKYAPIYQRYHKRLTRYLSWQWRIRSRKKDYEKPFNIGALINSIGIEHTEGRPIRTKETLENVLDTLTEDGVIKGWKYIDIDESQIGPRGWFENYWCKLQIVIQIPDELKKEFSEPSSDYIDYNKITEFGKSLHSGNNDIPLELKGDEIDISPSAIKSERVKHGLSINKAAEEIGIAHTTLSRYEKGLIKKPNSKNDEKIKKWMISIKNKKD